jgi:hypothetical protein
MVALFFTLSSLAHQGCVLESSVFRTPQGGGGGTKRNEVWRVMVDSKLLELKNYCSFCSVACVSSYETCMCSTAVFTRHSPIVLPQRIRTSGVNTPHGYFHRVESLKFCGVFICTEPELLLQ